MADAADPDTPPHKASLFLGCFGFSGKRIDISTTTSGKAHHKRSWFRRSTALIKQSAAGAKTVPLDSDQIQLKKNSSMFIKSKLKKKPAGHDFPLKPQSPAPVKPPQEQNSLKGRPSFDNKATTENGDLRKNDTLPSTPAKKSSFSKKTNATRNTSSQPGSPDQSNRTTVHRSASFPARVSTKKPPKEIPANNLDPMIGMSIIMVTLVILLIWGRLCAILCTCTWLYFVPRLRKKPVRTNGLVSPKLEPEEYMKKRVVFEGFLERNHNRTFL